MFLRGAYYYDYTTDVPPKKEGLFVLSAGRTNLITLSKALTCYFDRKDFQLIYIHKGSMHYFDRDNTEYIVPEGNFFLFKPHEYQNYVIYKNENTDFYWCHFSGFLAQTLLKKYNLYDKRVIPVSPNEEYCRLFTSIHKTLNNRASHFTEMCSLLLQQLLITISNDTKNNTSENKLPQMLTKVLEYINEHYHEDITIAKLAEINVSSKATLARQFEKYMDCPPKKYLNMIRIEQAKNLLLQTDYKINEIALTVGYQNPLYFSTVFHEETGLSPRDFRNLKRNVEEK